jgi:pimeloyl-ACP methyl ester carboxylesterase
MPHARFRGAHHIMIEDEFGRIDYHESGHGRTIVLVPGSCSTGAAWRPVIAQWGGAFRCVTTSLLGYGGTAERRTALDLRLQHEAEIVEAVIDRAACPVHLVGHSFGGLTALAVALRRRVPLLSLTVAEAPATGILRSMGEFRHYLAFQKMTDSYFLAFHAGEKTAIGRMIDFYGGAATFAGWPQRVRDYAVETTKVNLFDWASVYDFELTPALLATLEIPALVLWGEDSHPAARRANELLGDCMPNAVIHPIAGAAHFMISTHAGEVAGAIARHVVRAEQELCREESETTRGFRLAGRR